jgi:hypothetical protein
MRLFELSNPEPQFMSELAMFESPTNPNSEFIYIDWFDEVIVGTGS